jgi:putative sterol carrier protein
LFFRAVRLRLSQSISFICVELIESAAQVLPNPARFGFCINEEEQCQIVLLNFKATPSLKKHLPNDCELHCDEEVLKNMYTGALNPIRAFLDGRLRIFGDVGLALRLRVSIASS